MKKNIIVIISLVLCACIAASAIFIFKPKKNSGDKDKIELTDIDLVSFSGTDYRVVIPENASEYEAFAAEELKTFFKEATTHDIQIISDRISGGALDGKFISLGRTELYEKSGLNCTYGELGRDGFKIKLVQNTLVLAGGEDSGTLYAAYELLNVLFNFNVYGPDEVSVDIVGECKVPKFDLKDVPDIADRPGDFFAPFTNKVFAARMRTISGYGEPLFGGNIWSPWSHTHFYFLPKATYLDKHPDWYSSSQRQLCLANMDMRDELIKNIIAHIQKNPDAEYIMVGHEDNGDYCNCDKCNAAVEVVGKSGLMMQFINYVADGIKRWQDENCPNRRLTVATFAYVATEVAPVKQENGKYVPIDDSVIARDNVTVFVAPIYADWAAPVDDKDNNKNAREIMHGWRVISKNLAAWMYATNFDVKLLYFDDINSVKSNIMLAAEHGYRYYFYDVHRDVKQSSMFDTMRFFLVSRLMWDSSLDLEELIEEFMYGYYKEGGEGMLKAFQLLRHTVTVGKQEITKETKRYVGTGIWIRHVRDNVYSKDFWSKSKLDQIMSYIEEGYGAIKNSQRSEYEKENIIKRMELESLSIRLLLLEFFHNDYSREEYLSMVNKFIEDYDAHGLSKTVIDRSTTNTLFFENWKARA